MKFGLLGRKLSHSFSPFIHVAIGKEIGYRYEYELKEVEPDQLENFMKETELDGFNVTIPYKTQVMQYCTEVSDLAKRIGAVNTVVREKDGWHGYNTDYKGFSYMIEASSVKLAGKDAVILGAGGAAKMAQVVLEDFGAASVKMLGHKDIDAIAEGSYDEAALGEVSVVVNATPVGMYPNCGKSPVDLAKFSKLEAVFDLIYNPERTEFMLEAKSAKAEAFGGMQMLVKQACDSAALFVTRADAAASEGVIFEPSEIEKSLEEAMPYIVNDCKREMQNIVLVGMPGCGKSTLGKRLARATGKTFVDSDTVIVEKAGKSIPKIFEEVGEAGFRKIEAEVLAELGGKGGLIIATGGGCVTVKENYKALHQNAVIVWVQRRLEDLATAGRPISQSRKLSDIYEERKEKYESFADFAISGDGGVERAFMYTMEELNSWKY